MSRLKQTHRHKVVSVTFNMDCRFEHCFVVRSFVQMMQDYCLGGARQHFLIFMVLVMSWLTSLGQTKWSAIFSVAMFL